jgi:hypothetical protein
MSICNGSSILKAFWRLPSLWRVFPASLAFLLISFLVQPRSPAHPIDEFPLVSIGFASQDLRAPVSLFGHTFLIFSRQIPPEPSAVAIEFVGDLREGFEFILRALSGTLPGAVRMRLLSEKEREYDLQNRDLFYFTLNLAQDEEVLLRKRILQETAPDFNPGNYGFFRENCAFRVYSWILASRNRLPPPTIAHVPLRGLKSLQEEGFLSEVSFHRPSLGREVRESVNRLSEDEKSQLEFFAGGGNLPKTASADLRTSAALYSAFRIRNEPLESERNRLQDAIRPPVSSPPPNPEEDPLRGFYSNWFNAAASGNLFRLGYSPAIRNHFNLIRDELGDSFLEMGRANLTLKNSKPRIEDLTLIELDSLPGKQVKGIEPTRYFRLGYDYFRGLEVLYGMGIPLTPGNTRFSITPLAGLKWGGFRDAGSLQQPLHPEIGLRARADFWVASNLVFRNSVSRFLIESTEPEFRMESEVLWRLGRVTPFLRFRQIRISGIRPLESEWTFGTGFGI